MRAQEWPLQSTIEQVRDDLYTLSSSATKRLLDRRFLFPFNLSSTNSKTEQGLYVRLSHLRQDCSGPPGRDFKNFIRNSSVYLSLCRRVSAGPEQWLKPGNPEQVLKAQWDRQYLSEASRREGHDRIAGRQTKGNAQPREDGHVALPGYCNRRREPDSTRREPH